MLNNNDIFEIQIDPPRQMERRIGARLSRMVYAAAAIVAVAVIGWYLFVNPSGRQLLNSSAGVGQSHEAVEVAPHAKADISLSDAALVIDRGNTASLKAYARVYPNELGLQASDVRIRWVSECPEVATIDANGEITGHSVGVASIRALVNNTNVRANSPLCVVTVRDDNSPVAVSSHGRKVFGGSAIYDSKRRTIVFTDTHRFVIYTNKRNVVTMRRGDYISEAEVVNDSHLISGRFVKGYTSKLITGIAEEL